MVMVIVTVRVTMWLNITSMICNGVITVRNYRGSSGVRTMMVMISVIIIIINRILSIVAVRD